ncbi:MAG TPA: pirin family protein, partial [Candidatus Methylomirabilis sp.]|nr:pirin family protein [Candidatus Methylomirabilis sp.]
DNQGNTGVIQPGEVQVMSAGTGIVHSEYNHSKERPVHLLQLWIMPRTKGRKPRWEQRQFTRAGRSGALRPVVSDGTIPETLHIDQDATIYVSALKAGQEIAQKIGAGRKAYVFVIAGELSLNGTPLTAGDQARIADEPELILRAAEDAELILLDLP